MAITEDSITAQDITATTTLTVTHGGSTFANFHPESGKAYVNGRLGLGTSNPVNVLDVEGGLALGASYSGTETAPLNGALIEGNVGIGVVNPMAKLHVGGDVRVTTNLTVDGTFSGAVRTANLIDNAVTSAKLAEADGASGQNTDAGSGIKTGHIQDGAVTLQKLAEAVRPTLSIENVSNPGGNINLVPTNSISITGNNTTKEIVIGESHSAVVGNPHSTTAAQVGALPASGGTLGGHLTVNGNVGINTVPAHRLNVVAGDEADNQTYAVLSEATTGASAYITCAYSGTATSSGNSGVYGLNVAAIGEGAGFKCGVSSTTSGEGTKYSGMFTATSTNSGNTAYTQALYAYAYSAGTGSVYGQTITAGSDGTGPKVGILASASGTEGTKVGGSFSAYSYSSTTNTATSTAVVAQATGYGPAETKGLDIDVSGSGTGLKMGIDCSVNGEGYKYAGVFTSSNSSTTSNYGSYGLSISASTAGGGFSQGISLSATASGTGGATGASFGAYRYSGGGSAYTYGLSSSSYNASGSGGSYGLYTYAYGSSTGPKYGIYAGASGSGTVYAGYFSGNVHVAGTLSKSGGTFLIDHPGDPYNRVLRHNFVESPEDLCLYRGKVKLDANGQATVKLPSYFVALTKEDEATVTLTSIGRKPFLAGYEWNRQFDAFTVFGQPDGQVTYLVLANRDDPTIRVLRQPVEEDKVGEQKGKLLLPRAYPDSKPEDAAIRAPEPEIEAQMQQQRNESAQREQARKILRERMHGEHRTRDQQFKELSATREANEERRRKKETAFKRRQREEDTER